MSIVDDSHLTDEVVKKPSRAPISDAMTSAPSWRKPS
jgi:hypothetical protein